VRSLLLVGWLALCVLAYYAWPAEVHRRRCVRRFLRGALALVGVRLTTSGEPATTPRLLLSNHLSWLDILVLGGASGSAFVAHDALAGQPLMRWLCDLNHTLYVGRHERGKVTDQVTRLADKLTRGETLTLFPEGTTGDGVALLPFKSSLLAAIELAPAATAVQPVWTDYGADASAIAWFGEEAGVANFLRILARRKALCVTVHFLAPIEEAERASRKAMASAAQQRIEAAVRQQDRRRPPQRVAL
jgi:1-acyl-sn-glycerol-3-phosphate acyltransferase